MNAAYTQKRGKRQCFRVEGDDAMAKLDAALIEAALAAGRNGIRTTFAIESTREKDVAVGFLCSSTLGEELNDGHRATVLKNLDDSGFPEKPVDTDDITKPRKR